MGAASPSGEEEPPDAEVWTGVGDCIPGLGRGSSGYWIGARGMVQVLGPELGPRGGGLLLPAGQRVTDTWLGPGVGSVLLRIREGDMTLK